MRRFRRSALWLLVVVGTWAIGWQLGLEELHSNNEWAIALLVFVLPFLSALAFGYCVIYGGRVVWQRVWKSDLAYDEEAGEFSPNKALQPTRQSRAPER